MPLPKDMEACMHKMKKEYPEGRSKKSMSKEGAQKQRVAACLQASGKSKNEGEEPRFQTFLEFLAEIEA